MKFRERKVKEGNEIKIKHGGRIRDATLALLGLILLMGPGTSASQLGPVNIPPTWGGDLSSRPRLSGNWGEMRDELGKKGVVFDVDTLMLPQGVVTGGNNTTGKFWGTASYTLNLDTSKMGFWPGGFFKIEGVSSFGNTLYSDVGAVVPTNVSTLYPGFLQADSGLMGATFTQFFSPKLGVFMGKNNLFDFVPTEFYGNYRNQFMNTALNISMAYGLVPMSAFGGGFVFLPSKNITLMSMALDANGSPTNNKVDKAFDDGATILTAALVKIKPFGLGGNQKVTGVWSNKNRFALDQDPTNIGNMLLHDRFPSLGDPGRILSRILEKYFPELLEPVQPANRKDHTWAITYGFDQYLWQPDGDPHRGIGLFFNFGVTDGNPNPVQYSYMMGIGSKGIMPGRPYDSFGIGWAHTQFSDQFIPLLRQKLNLGLDYEDAVELYYNAPVTPWLSVSPNLQVIDSGMNKTLSKRGALQDLNTVVEASLRMNIRF